ncbi:MAG: ABC transporter substrate-binding protein [Firmicutes bacterium]|nr:ABC transporter substrate-binding protein [Bacillota bacterium]
MSKQSKLINVLLGLTLTMAIMLLGGCGGTATKEGQNAAQAPADKIKIGVIGAFSGPSAEMGIPMRTGIEMAADEINTAGGINGKQVQVIAYDDEADSSKNATMAHRLIESDNVLAILAAPNSGTAIATATVCRASSVPQIVPIAQSPEVLEPASSWVFRITPNNYMDIARLIDYVKQKGWKNVAILHDTSAFGQSGEKILLKAIPDAGLNVVVNEGHQVGMTDMTAQALAIKQSNPDVVIEWNLGADGAVFANNLKNIGYKVPLLSSRGLMFDVYTRLGGDAVEGTIAPGSIDYTKKEAQDFIQKYTSKTGSAGSIDFAALGYDSMYVLAEALKQSEQNPDRQHVRDAIQGIKGFKPVTGYSDAEITFAPDKQEGADMKNSVLQVVKNGKWVNLD